MVEEDPYGLEIEATDSLKPGDVMFILPIMVAQMLHGVS